MDDALIARMGSAAIDICLAELGVAEEPGEVEPVAWANLTDPVPEWFILAAGFLLTHYYENRAPVVVGSGVNTAEIPLTVRRILELNRERFFN